MSSKILSRAGAVALLVAPLILAAPLSASAHVRVHPEQAVAGADGTLLTFSVPTESATATTTGVVVDLPTATPFGYVSYQPVPGWTAKVVTGALPKPAAVAGTRVTEAPVRVVWTADPGTKLAGGQFQDFVLSVGPMPDTGRIAFPTTQTYSDGTVVRWNEATTSSGAEPDRPAPVLYINDAPPPAERLVTPVVGLSAQPPAAAGDLTVVAVLAAAALVVAILAAALALTALIWSRRSRRP